MSSSIHLRKVCAGMQNRAGPSLIRIRTSARMIVEETELRRLWCRDTIPKPKGGKSAFFRDRPLCPRLVAVCHI